MNKGIVISIGVIWISFSFFSCATLNKDECLTADWYQIGYEDGAKGYPLSRIGKHRKACAKHGVTPDMPPYEQDMIRDWLNSARRPADTGPDSVGGRSVMSVKENFKSPL